MVLHGVPDSRDAEPGVIRLKSLGSDSVVMSFQEWGYLDGVHAAEPTSWLAMDTGVYAETNHVAEAIGVLVLE